MPAFVIETLGKSVMTMKFPDQFALEAIISGDDDKGREFRTTLMCMKTNGVPVWDGKSPINYRRATSGEVRDFAAAFSKTVVAGFAENFEEDDFVHFLIPIEEDEVPGGWTGR